jgi:hypothetical protein
MGYNSAFKGLITQETPDYSDLNKKTAFGDYLVIGFLLGVWIL